MIPSRPTAATDHPRYHLQTTDDGSRTMIDPTTRVAFHSGCGAVAETRHVYLANSGLAERMDTASGGNSNASLAPGISRVLEIGVGLGLGLLMTVDHAVRHSAPLEYVGIERDLLAPELLEGLQYDSSLLHPDLADQYRRFLKTCDQDQVPPTYQWQASSDVMVTIEAGEFDAVIDRITGTFDAIYFDPFDPATNPEMWTIEVFRVLRVRSHERTRLVTYCVNRQVRDALAVAGWTCHRVPGPEGGKREVLIAKPT